MLRIIIYVVLAYGEGFHTLVVLAIVLNLVIGVIMEFGYRVIEGNAVRKSKSINCMFLK